MPYDHASMLLLGEGSEATEPYNKYANLFKYISYVINLINPFGRHFCRPCDRRHIVAQMAGDEMSLALRDRQLMIFILGASSLDRAIKS